jgi:hypothetical protein
MIAAFLLFFIFFISMVHLFPAEKENQSPCKIARTGYRKKEKKSSWLIIYSTSIFHARHRRSPVITTTTLFFFFILTRAPPFIIYYFLPLNCQVRRAKVTPLTTGNDAALKAPTFGYR